MFSGSALTRMPSIGKNCGCVNDSDHQEGTLALGRSSSWTEGSTAMKTPKHTPHKHKLARTLSRSPATPQGIEIGALPG